MTLLSAGLTLVDELHADPGIRRFLSERPVLLSQNLTLR